MKSNIREIIRYIDDTTLEKSNDEKKAKKESTSTILEEVQEFVNLTITEHIGKAYSERKLNQDKEPVSEIDKKYQKLLETLSQEQEEVITEYCNAIFMRVSSNFRFHDIISNTDFTVFFRFSPSFNPSR